MTCGEVRDQLSEHALGLLASEDQREVERHLQWCAGCRKESAELLEGMATVAMSIPQAEPPEPLEGRVMGRVHAAAGKLRTRGYRRGIRILAVATLAASLTAGTAIGWGFAQRRQALDARHQLEAVESRLQGARERQQSLARAVLAVQKPLQIPGTLYEVNLYPGLNHEAAGTALLFSVPEAEGFAVVDVVVPLDDKRGPYTVTLIGESDRVVQLGKLRELEDGTYQLWLDPWPQRPFPPDTLEVSQARSLEVVDRYGKTVLRGSVLPFVAVAPSP